MLGDTRTRGLALQFLLVLAVVGMASILVTATVANLKARGIPLGFDFLFRPAGFNISETILPYSPRDPNWWAVIVGIANTLFVSVVVLVLSSVLGLLVGIGRLSSNPLVNGTARVWVEIARNTPVIILLIFLYALWWKVLPPVTSALTLAPGVHLSIRGLVLPSVTLGMPPMSWLAAPAAMLAVVAAAWLASIRQAATGIRPPFVPITFAALAALLASMAMAGVFQPSVDWPVMGRANFSGGLQLTPELTTILIGLTLYTTGFIAEIVRGGILAIDKGQWEAARSIGLKETQVLRLVVIPQMLRGILPPLNSQYVNVVKNSTLAITVGYQDFMTIVGTMINKTSHAIEGIAIILGVFLALNLMLSGVMNWVNRRMAIVER